MPDSILVFLYAHDTHMNAKRGSQPSPPSRSPPRASGLPKNVVIGIILGVIAIVICVIVAFLLFRLARQNRRERRQMQKVDLLEEARFSTVYTNNLEKEPSEAQRNEKALPRIPSSISVKAPLDGQNVRHSVSWSRSSIYASKSEVPTLQAPSTTYRGHNVASSSIDSIGLSTGPSSTSSHSIIPSASSVTVASRSGNDSNLFGTGSSESAEILRGKFTVVNVTDTDATRLQRPQLVYLSSPEYAGRIRGRDQPFPSRMDRKMRPPSIITQTPENVESAVYKVPYTEAGYPVEKPKFLDVPSMPDPPTPGTSYTVHIPSAQDPELRGLAPPRARLPVTITASRPVSNIIVESTRSIRRPNGTKGKGRMVTMSVLVEDSDASTSEVDALENGRVSQRESYGSQGVLGNLLEDYTTREGDLPPYTPRETTR